jgi:hypothetical protein
MNFYAKFLDKNRDKKSSNFDLSVSYKEKNNATFCEKWRKKLL